MYPVNEEDGADVSPEEPEQETVEVEAEPEEVKEPEENEAESPPAVEEDDDKKTDPVQGRIDELTKNWRETQRALDQRERELKEMQDKIAAIPEPVEEVKTLADFEYDEKQYQQYIFAEARKQGEKAAQGVMENFQGKANAETAETVFRSKEAEFALTVKDYNEVVYDSSLHISQSMAEAIKASDIGPELSYHLGKNPDIAARIAVLPASVAGRELGKLEAVLEAGKAKASEKSVSQAPAPAKTKLRGASASLKVATTDPASDELSDAEWFKREQARQAKLRG